MSGDRKSLVLPARIIDVKGECIVPLEAKGPETIYITLSYVWGQTKYYTLNTQNKTDLTTPGFFKSIEEQLPQTVKDAMEVARRLQIRYLWVDALCIIQDDADDRTHEILCMDSIYEGSAFTIVAASGTHANAGLAPLHGRKEEQECETVWPGIRVIAIHDVKDIIRASKYGSRGWTFQEQVLSSRLLVFTDNVVYFQCHDCTWSENSRAEKWPEQRFNASDDSLTTGIVEFQERPWVLYCKYLEMYSQRELTKEEDTVDAMMGILQRLRRRLGGDLVYGLFTEFFEYSLQFVPSTTQRRLSFPSYSWAGWKGPVTLAWSIPLKSDPPRLEESELSDSDDDRSGTLEGTAIWQDSGSQEDDDSEDDDLEEDDYSEEFYSFDEDAGSEDHDEIHSHADSSRNSDSPLSPSSKLKDNNENADMESSSASESSGFSESVAEGVYKNTWIVWYKRTFQQPPQLIADRYNLPERQNDISAMKLVLFKEKVTVKGDVLQTHPSDGPLDLNAQIPRDYSVLQFWTTSLKLRLRNFKVSLANVVDLVDADDKWCGQLRLPSDFVPQYETVADLILLGGADYHHFLKRDPTSLKGFGRMHWSSRKDPILPKCYQVMWIQWHGDIAERIGVGEIRSGALRRPVENEIVWKEIILK